MPPSSVLPACLAFATAWAAGADDMEHHAARMRHETDQEIGEEEDAEDCNGWCRPDVSLYEALCPAHGLRVLIDALNDVT